MMKKALAVIVVAIIAWAIYDYSGTNSEPVTSEPTREQIDRAAKYRQARIDACVKDKASRYPGFSWTLDCTREIESQDYINSLGLDKP